jgi:hypothetical protein
MSRSGRRSTTRGAYPAPPTTGRWTGQSAPPTTTSTWVLSRRTSVSFFPVVAHAVLSMIGAQQVVSVSTNRPRIYIYIKNLPRPMPEHYCHYYAESTKHHLLVDGFPEPFMPEQCSREPIVGRHTYSLSLCITPHSFFAAHHQLHQIRFIKLMCQNANLMYMAGR